LPVPPHAVTLPPQAIRARRVGVAPAVHEVAPLWNLATTVLGVIEKLVADAGQALHYRLCSVERGLKIRFVMLPRCATRGAAM